MSMMRRIMNIVFAVMLMTHSAFAAEMFTITELGPPGASTRAVAMNNAGDVAGNGNTNHAFLWSKGVMTDLGVFYVVAINNAKQVIGTYSNHSYIWDNGVLTDLGTLGGAETTARALNDSGVVVGESLTVAGLRHAFLWKDGVLTDLGTLEGNSVSSAWDINNAGQIVGTSSGTSTGEIHPPRVFLWSKGEMVSIGTSPGSYPGCGAYWEHVLINEKGTVTATADFCHTYDDATYLLADGNVKYIAAGRPISINESGQVAGHYEGSYWRDGYFFENGLYTKLGVLDNYFSSAVQGMNDSGQVVGTLSHPSGTPLRHAFIWEDNVMSYLPSPTGVYSEAVAINASGQVAGSINYRAVLWTPINSEKSTRMANFREGHWCLDVNGNQSCDGNEYSGSFGIPGDVPVSGKWNGSEKTMTGVFRDGAWFLDMNGNGAWDEGIDAAYSFGIATDIPITGDWSGSGTTNLGFFRDGTWFFDVNGNGAWDEDTDKSTVFGIKGDIPVTGDWTGTGTTKIGVRRGSTWFLDMNGNGSWDDNIDATYSFGIPTDVPVTGDWNGSGTTKIGVVRESVWYLDMNGNGNWDNISDAVSANFDDAGGIPLTGHW